MEKVKSKVIASLVTVMMIICLLPATVFADTTIGGDHWSYDKQTKTLTVSYEGAMPNFPEVMIPGGTEAPWSMVANEAETIVIANGTTTIGAQAFAGMSNVTKVVFPTDGRLTSIGKWSFWYCAIENLVIPAGVTSIGEGAFKDNCLHTLKLPNTLKTFGSWAFACEDPAGAQLTSVVIPNSVTTIGASSFCGQKKLTSVTGGAGVVTIGSGAFNGCSKLSTFKITSSKLKTIGNSAFKGCSKLKTLYIQKTTKLTKKSVKNSLKGSSITTIKVTSSKVKTYKSYFVKSNSGKSVTVKK